MISRFSEDIDVTYDIRELIGDLTGNDDEPLPSNDSQQRKWRKAIEAKLPDWVESVIAPHLCICLAQDQLEATVEIEGDRIWIRHTPVSEGWGYMKPDVMIEFGARSTGLPIDTLTITCDAARDLPDLTFPTAEPRVMRAERTFWEKATAVHAFCAQGRLGAERLARHWYDLVLLDQAGHATRALADRELAQQVADHKSAFFAVKGVDYHAAVAGSLTLVPEDQFEGLLQTDYAAMVEHGLLDEAAPSFDDLMIRCRDLQARVNAAAG